MRSPRRIAWNAWFIALACPFAADAQSGPPQQVRLNDAVPAGVRTTQLSITADARHVYYGDSARSIWLFDRTSKHAVRLVGGPVSDLAVSPSGDAIAFVRTARESADQYVWMLPLDSATGLARGAERRVGALQGDSPAFSADGRWIAFAADDSNGVGQGIAIAPIIGGAERLVVPFSSTSISGVRWSPDGRALYYALNGPVPCDPEWSCLPLKGEFKQRAGSLRRVGVSGGSPSVIVSPAEHGWPGLSIDGSLLVYSDTGFGSRMIVADATGRRLNMFTLPVRETVEGWMNGSTVVLTDRGDVRRVRVRSIANGAARIISDTLDQLADGVFSPDGRAVSAARCVGNRCELRIIGTDGRPRTVVALPNQYGGGNVWSPDGKWIAYVGGSAIDDRTIEIIEVSTGRIVPLATVRSSAVTLQWQANGRGLVVSSALGTGAQRRVAFERVDLDGHTQPLREFIIGPAPSGAMTLDEHTGALLTKGELRYVTFDGDSANTLIFAMHDARLAGMLGTASGTRRVALRRTRTGDGEYDIIEVMDLDGSNRATIELPFGTYPGPNGLRMLPGGKQLVVLGGPWASERDVGVYLVDVASKTWKKLATIPVWSFAPELAVSADGTSVLYMTNDAGAPRVYTMDLSSFKR